MKKNLLAFVLLLWGSALAQQKTFEFFKWDDVQHPLTDWRRGASQRTAQQDSKSRYWYGSLSQGKILLSNYSDTSKIVVDLALTFKVGYQYQPYISFDESDNVLVHLYGSRYVNSKYSYDNHLVRLNLQGQASYLPPSVFGGADSTVWIKSFASINNKVAVVLSNNTIVWDGGVPLSTIYTSPSILSNYKDALYLVQGGQLGFEAFYADGTRQKLLDGENIRNYTFDAKLHTFSVLTPVGAYMFEGKKQLSLNIPAYQTLIRSYSVDLKQFSLQGYNIEVLMSKKGFNITHKGQASSYVFSDHIQNVDSLSFAYVNLQEDSTLLLLYWSEQSSYVKELYTFVWKNGASRAVRIDNVSKYNIYTKSQAAAYLGVNLYTYLNDYGHNSILQIKGADSFTSIPYKSEECPAYIMNIAADKNYLWVSNEATQESTCSVSRMAHDSYFVSGRVFYDANANGTKEPSEFWYGKLTLKVKPSGLLLFPDTEGRFAFKGEAGAQYSVGLLDSSLFSSIKTEYTGNIGVKLKDESPEISASFWLPASRCGTNRAANFSLHNKGVVPVDRVVIRLVPQGLQLLKDNVLVDTAVFTHDNLGAGQYVNVSYNIQWPTPDVVGQTATLKTITELYVGNVLASSKVDSVQTVIRCSYDPNDKSVTPVGVGEEGYALKKNALKYLIRFENTGNDTAYNIVVVDTLSQQLDWSSFKLLGNSHLVNAELSAQGVLSFHFNDIMLPDTGKGKEVAQGYVSFALSPKADVAENSRLCNRAAIYFDGNKPVITNLACNTLVEKIPTVVKVDEQLLMGKKGMLYPNPAQDMVHLANGAHAATLYNALGEEVLQSSGGKLNLVGVPNGVYLVRVAHQNGTVSTEKLSVVR